MFEVERKKLMEAAGDNRVMRMMASQTMDIVERTKCTGRIMAEDKNLAELEKLFKKYADGQKQGNSSCITPDEAEKLICDYFEITIDKPSGKLNVLDLL